MSHIRHVATRLYKWSSNTLLEVSLTENKNWLSNVFFFCFVCLFPHHLHLVMELLRCFSCWNINKMHLTRFGLSVRPSGSWTDGLYVTLYYLKLRIVQFYLWWCKYEGLWHNGEEKKVFLKFWESFSKNLMFLATFF